MPIALVTGAGGGIGRAVCLKMAEMGYHVVLAGRSVEALEQVADEVRRVGTEALVVPTDVTKPDHIEKTITQALETWGEINVVVNCAGQAPLVPTHQVSPEQWREILEANLSSAFYVIRAVWPHMQRQHYAYLSEHRDKQGVAHLPAEGNSGGMIVNISSMSSKDPFPGLGAYGVAKAGLNMLTHVMAQEGEPVGIRVLGIAPGAVETKMFRGMFDTDQVPAEEVLHPDEVAGMVEAFVGGALRNSSGETVFLHRRM
jgi:NAD(P)-dependent dehydrogenase (short-subunit alcohol dehydrogenase family)